MLSPFLLAALALCLEAATASSGNSPRILQYYSQKATCVLDPSLVNAETLPLLEDIGVSIFASACGKNRGAFVLDSADGHTYGCLNLPEQRLLDMLDIDESSNTTTNFNLSKVEDITENYANGNITAGDAVELLSFLVERVYASTPGVDITPYACDISGLVTLEDCPARRRRRLEEESTDDNALIDDGGNDDGASTSSSKGSDRLVVPEPKKEDELDSDGKSVPIRATTIAGVFSPMDVWAVNNSSTPEGVTLTQRDAEYFYVPKDFNAMSVMGLNAVQFPVAVDLFATMARPPIAWLNLLTKWIRYTAKYKMQAIVKLEYTRHSQDEVALLDAVKEAMIFCNGINVNLNKTAVKAVSLPSASPAVMAAAASADTAIPLWLPAKLQDLTHVQELASTVAGVKIDAISLDLSHISTISDIASSSSVEDRNKMVFHETMACLNRAPLEYTECYQGLPVFVSSGFDLATDDCHLKRVADYPFQDYGQCNRLAETTHSHWWKQHRLSFASRQIAAYEKGGMGWSFATWKVFRVGKEKVGLIDKPAKLLSLQDVHANGWMPSLTKHQHQLSLACLNPPTNDAVLGDATLSPTMGPPPDCGDGWWNYTTKQCDFWIPPPFNATECPNTTIIYEACPDATTDVDVDAGANGGAESDSSTHSSRLWEGFLGGLLVASIVFAILYRCCFASGKKQYQLIPELSNGFQEYQHHSQNSLRGAISDQPNSLARRSRT